MNILIVDDSKAMRMIIRRTLRQADMGDNAISEASNGLEALSMVRAGAPDLILCDWNMPEMTGIELLSALKELGFAGRFGLVTSECSPEMQARAQTAGARFIISKPFTADAFQNALGPLVT